MELNTATLQMLYDSAVTSDFQSTLEIVAQEHDMSVEKLTQHYNRFCRYVKGDEVEG